MRNSDESPSSRHRHHHYQSKSKSKVDVDSGDDLNEEERYRQEDLRTKLNQLKKGKDQHKDRVSSSDREQHDKHRNSRQLQVHDYDASYYKSSSKKESYNRDYNYQQKHYSHHYQQERSYSSDSRTSSDQKRSSSKTTSSNVEKYIETDSKTDKHVRSKIKIEAEVNEIVSEEEKSSANESNDEEKPKKLTKSSKDKESGDDKRASSSKEQSPKEEGEESDNIRAEIALRNKLKRRIQEAGANQSDEDDTDSTKKLRKEKRKQRKDDSSNSRSPRKQRSDSPSSTVSNVGSNRNSDQQSQSVGSNRSDSESTESEYNDKTPDRKSLRTDSESEHDELDEKMEDYYKKMATKKPTIKLEEPKLEVDNTAIEEAKSTEPIAPPPPPPPEIVTYYCAVQGSRSVEEFECLNKIEEGAYGVVFRAKDKKSNEVVALKRLKMEKEKEGFPITSIREIDTLLKSQHPNVVTVREIVVGSNMDKIYMVMDYVEHDLKSLMQYSMKKPFMMSEVKTLMIQLLRGVAHLHDNWIIHRDLKTSNLLLSHKGVLKIADFGLAREYGSPLKEYTSVVVTLWYRCPELLLATKKYSTGVDIWSVGCIFGELMLMKALFPGKNEKDQLDKIFKDLGTPNDKIWPGFKDLPLAKSLNFPQFPYNTLRSRFGNYLSDKGFNLLNKLLTYDPKRRISAEDALKDEFFKETPLPIDPTMFPTWPAKSEGLAKNKLPQDSEPRAPSPAKMYEKLISEDDGFVLQLPISTGFTLR